MIEIVGEEKAAIRVRQLSRCVAAAVSTQLTRWRRKITSAAATALNIIIM